MEPYTKEYYNSINIIERPQAVALAEILEKMYKLRSVVDLGCGTGLYMAQFHCDAYGIDISEAAFDKEVVQVPEDVIAIGDLTQPRTVRIKHNLALCLEVVEHIGEESADAFLDNLVQYSDTIVMTAAPPGQAGLNHVNCQPMGYWEEKMAKRGFKRDYYDEYQIVSFVVNAPHTVWIIRNLMVFKKI